MNNVLNSRDRQMFFGKISENPHIRLEKSHALTPIINLIS